MCASYFIYLHPELSGKPDINKLGRGATPHSVVRLRQRFLADDFHLTHLWWGLPDHIRLIEQEACLLLSPWRVAGAARTELFARPVDHMRAVVNGVISRRGFRARELTEWAGYHGTSARDCPMRVPSEGAAAEAWLDRQVGEDLGTATQRTIFESFFS